MRVLRVQRNPQPCTVTLSAIHLSATLLIPSWTTFRGTCVQIHSTSLSIGKKTLPAAWKQQLFPEWEAPLCPMSLTRPDSLCQRFRQEPI